MTSFTFTAEQLRAAPPEVRRWAENEIAAAFAPVAARTPPLVHDEALGYCTPEEASQMFEMLRGNFLLTQVFFELARETPQHQAAPMLHALSIGDLLRHTRLADGDRLAEYLTMINEAFRKIRGDAEVSLFGFDPYGHVFIDKRTHQSIRRLWQALTSAQLPESAASLAPAGVALPRLGPSEEIAAHQAIPSRFGA